MRIRVALLSCFLWCGVEDSPYYKLASTLCHDDCIRAHSLTHACLDLCIPDKVKELEDDAKAEKERKEYFEQQQEQARQKQEQERKAKLDAFEECRKANGYMDETMSTLPGDGLYKSLFRWCK
jgi:hypothetical protein